MANRISRGRVLGGRFEADKADGVRANKLILPDHILVTFFAAANAELVDTAFFIADRAYTVDRIDEVHGTLGSDGGAVNVMPRKTEGTEAPASGQALITTAFDLKATVETVQNGTLTATSADLDLAAGDRLAVDFTGTLTAVAGLVVTVRLKLK